MPVQKAAASDFPGRFREIISDPMNLGIARVETAGLEENGLVTLHNGHRVPLRGPGSYYGAFSEILILNRGVHEPLEEFVFQQVLKTMPDSPAMVELGANWAHYSMWLMQVRPRARTIMVEPGDTERQAGIDNFRRHGYEGHFIAASIGAAALTVDSLLAEQRLDHLDILHADIQGAEVEMLQGARKAFGAGRIDNVFVSTHSQALHHACQQLLAEMGFRVEVSADFDEQTTSYDGLLFARRKDLAPQFEDFAPLGRTDIASASPGQLIAALRAVLAD